MRRLAAIMFTDIAGYTALMQQDEQEALSIRNTHRKHFNELTEKHEGKIIQYYGDGTLSVFNSAYQSVLCAIELQQAFQGLRPVPVRIGIHMGEIIFDEEDIIGDAVNIASRIESIGKVGSVLISEKIFEEIKNKKELQAKPLGAFQFKNVSHPVKVYAMIDNALYVPNRIEFDGKVKNKQKTFELPIYHNSFIGRTHHINAISSLLQKDKTRLISLLGPGGMGKTRLSVKVGEELNQVFEHSVCFVPLDVVTDPEQVPLYIGHSLGLKESFDNSWVDEIVNFLADKNLLLILDNLEQILEAAVVIGKILDACPRIKILATSREILGLPHEIEYPLDSLNRPNPRLFPGPKDLLKFDAIKLFVQKAQASLPNFELTEDNAEAIVQICQNLDGLPLPIELAAARIKLFSPNLILKKLENNSDLLKTKSKEVALRHQTIRNTVKWSYDLLDEDEQQLFQQLSLFRGGFTLESLEQVCPDFDSLDVVESFINKSLVLKGKEIGYVSRFRMLKLIRDYGLEQLQHNPQRETFYHNFAQYFISFSEAAGSKLQGPEQPRWIALFLAEFENLIVALEWLMANAPEKAGRIGADFWRLHLNQGFLREGVEMLEKLLSLPIEDKKTIMKLLEGAGVLSQNLGNYLIAKAYFERYLNFCADFQDKNELVKALNNLAWAEMRIGHYDNTISYSEKALDISIQLDDRQGQAKSLNNLAWTYMRQGLFEKTVQLQRQVLDIHTKANNKRGIAFAKINLGRALLHTGKISEAKHLVDDGIQLFEALKNQQLVTFSRMAKAEILVDESDFVPAKELLLQRCLPNFEKIGDLWGASSTHTLLGKIYFLEEQFVQAAFHLTRSLNLFHDSNDKFGEAHTYLWLSKLKWSEGDHSIAEDFLDRSLNLAASIGAIELLKDGYVEKALRALQQKSYAMAITCFAIADHYADILGAHKYDKFRLEVNQNLETLQQSMPSAKIALDVSLSEQWQAKEFYLAKPLDQKEMQKRIRKLLGHSQDTQRAGPSSYRSDESIGFSESYRKSSEDPFGLEVHRIIEDHLHEHEFTIKDLCREIGMSHSQLHRRINLLTGQSITKIIRTIRLNKAKELLEDPKLTIAAVAYDTGFKDPDYFHRVFKKAFEMTPGEYRQSTKKNRN